MTDDGTAFDRHQRYSGCAIGAKRIDNPAFSILAEGLSIRFANSRHVAWLLVSYFNQLVLGLLLNVWALRHEHDLARDASPPEQLLRLSCLGQRKLLRDERLDLLLSKKVKQADQILSKP